MAWDEKANEVLGTKITDILEENDISVTGTGKNNEGDNQFWVEMEWYSPAGEDFVFSVWVEEAATEIETKNNFIKAVEEYAEDFDVDEHVSLYIESLGKGGVPDSARTLVEDAEATKDFLTDLVVQLEAGEAPVKEEKVLTQENETVEVTNFDVLTNVTLQLCKAEIEALSEYAGKELKADEISEVLHSLVSDADKLAKEQLNDKKKPKDIDRY